MSEKGSYSDPRCYACGRGDDVVLSTHRQNQTPFQQGGERDRTRYAAQEAKSSTQD